MLNIESLNFDKLSRYIRAWLEIYFDDNDPVIIDKDTALIDFNIEEETMSLSSKGIIGEPTANMLSAYILNQNDTWNPLNASSPYFNMIKLGTKIKVFVSEGDAQTACPLGTFYLADWNTTTNSVKVSIKAYDRLHHILKQPTPRLQVQKNIQAGLAFKLYFNALGVPDTDLLIDSSLTETIDMLFPNKGNFAAMLTDLTMATLTECFVDRQDRIVVKKITTNSAPVNTFSDSVNLRSTDISTSIVKDYHKLVIGYNAYNIEPSTATLTLNDVSIPSSINLIVTNPLYAINYIHINADAVASNLEYTPYDVNFDITTETATTADVVVYGNAIAAKSNTAEYSIESNSDNVLRLDSPYIQTKSRADAISAVLLQAMRTEPLCYKCNTRGNPLLELTDIVTIDDTTNNIHGDAKIVGARYYYNGSIQGTYTVYNNKGLRIGG